MNRITPEQVLKAYEETGLKPKQDIWYDNSRCGCGLTAVILSDNPTLERLKDKIDLDDFLGTNFFHLLININEIDYINGFISGFDNDYARRKTSDLYVAGINDGKAAWEAVKHLAI